MTLGEYKSKLREAIAVRYPQEETNPALLGEHAISFEKALGTIRKAHSGQAVWNCRISNDNYIFQVSTGPKKEGTLNMFEYYVDCNTGKTGFYGISYDSWDWDWDIETERDEVDIPVWIDLSPEEVQHCDRATHRLRNRLLSATLME